MSAYDDLLNARMIKKNVKVRRLTINPVVSGEDEVFPAPDGSNRSHVVSAERLLSGILAPDTGGVKARAVVIGVGPMCTRIGHGDLVILPPENDCRGRFAKCEVNDLAVFEEDDLICAIDVVEVPEGIANAFV
jgi:hypothetical protein